MKDITQLILSAKQDITQYTDNELILQVENTKSLYLLKDDINALIEDISSNYIYTDIQIKNLMNHLTSEVTQ